MPAIGLVLLSSCSSSRIAGSSPVQYEDVALPKEDEKALISAASRQMVSIPAATQASGSAPDIEYRIGPGDELTVNVNGEESMQALALRVDSAGFIQLPIVSRVNVQGATLAEIQEQLVKAYSEEFVDPWVVVSISKFRSRPIYMLGELRLPGVVYLEEPTNIMQALALAGGVTENAYLDGARLLREDKIVAVDIEALLSDGKLDQNVWLQPRDTIYVPGTQDLKVFVLGAVDTPGAQPFERGVGLLAAISSAGGTIGGEARLKDTRIIRTHSPLKGELITIDVDGMLRGARPDFPLRAGDIVFVPNTPLGNWNEVVRQITPSFQLVSEALEPFVQIEFLKDDE